MELIQIIVNKIEVTARLIRFDKKFIKEGVEAYNKHRPNKKTPDTIDNYKGIKLCNYKDKWWIYYNKDHMTGSFKNKKEAISWFVKAGR